jgi:hypothetical protein
MFLQTGRATLASVIGLALGGTMYAGIASVEAAQTLPNTRITLTKAEHVASKLVITGKTRRARQIVKLDNPARSKTSDANRAFRIVAPLLPGDCEI